eukprot:7716062-Alexandrium_andersonii.AAC.1
MVPEHVSVTASGPTRTLRGLRRLCARRGLECARAPLRPRTLRLAMQPWPGASLQARAPRTRGALYVSPVGLHRK